MQQSEELRHDALHLIGHEHLVAVELNLVALQLDVALYAWEVEYAGEVERIVDVEVNPEQRLVLHGVERAVERLVVFVLQCARCLCPQRLHIVYNVVLVGVYLLAVLPLGLLAEGHGHRHKLAILVQQLLNLDLVKKFLAVVVDVENDVGTTILFFCIADFKLRTAVTAPFHGLCAVFVAACHDLHLLAHHE